MSEPKTSASSRQAPLSLWRAAQAFLHTLFDMFGAPEQLAARHTLTFAQHALILPWLRAGEALLRRLLLIEAALLEGKCIDTTPPPARGRLGGGRRIDPHPIASQSSSPLQGEGKLRRIVEHDPEHPDAWRVSFRIFSSPVYGGGDREAIGGGDDGRLHRPHRLAALATSPAGGGRKTQAPRFRSAWPIAERFEALLRVCNDPAPYAQRLASRLRKASALAQRIATSAWGQCRDLVGHSLHDALTEPITNAARVFAERALNTS